MTSVSAENMKTNATCYILVFVVNMFSKINKKHIFQRKKLDQMFSRFLIKFSLIWYIIRISDSVISLTGFNHTFKRIR